MRPACLLALLLLCAPTAHSDTLESTLSGVEGELRRALDAHLVDSQGGETGDISAGRVRALYRRAPSVLREGLEALGYYDANIEPTLVQKGGSWRADYAITAGEPVRVRELRVELRGEAANDAAFAGCEADFPLQPGDRLQHASYEAGKAALRRLLADRGYFDARFLHAEVRVSRVAREAGIKLLVDSGPRFRIGSVHWPKIVLAPTFLDRYLDFPQDAAFHVRELRSLRRRLVDSNYFGNVAITPRRDLAEGLKVPLEVELEPRKSRRYSLGAGFGTDTGPRGRASWTRPYLNPRGDRLEADLRVSPVQSSLGAQFTRPLPGRWTDALTAFARLQQEDTDTTRATRLVMGGAHLTERWGWQETLGLEYEIEGYDVADATQLARLLVPSVRWSRVWADDPVYPRDGLRLALGLRGADAAVLSRTSFLQARVEGKYVRAFGETRLITRAEVGALATASFEKLPPSERFFAGGDNSLRGFDYQQLGPRNARGKVTGGRYLAVGSVELEQTLRGEWSAAVFSDFGNAMNRWSDPLACSVGIGARWRSPIGMVRVDLANGVSDPDHPWRLHLTVGPDL